MGDRTLAAYGKLPLSKEFLRHACYEGSSLEFKGWIDAGYDRFSAREIAHVPSDGAPRRLLYLPKQDGEWVVAVSVNSHDASGERRFPFTLYTLLASHEVGHSTMTTSLEPVWDALEEELERLRNMDATETFFAEIRSARVEADPLPRDRATAALEEFQQSPASEWIEGLYHEDPEDLWVRGLWRLRSLLPALHAGTRAPYLAAVRVPLSPVAPLGVQIDHWRALIAGLHPSYDGVPSLLLPGRSDAMRAAYLIARHLEADDFPPVVGGDLDAERFTDLAVAGGRLPSEGFGAFRERLEEGPLASDARVFATSSFDLKL